MLEYVPWTILILWLVIASWDASKKHTQQKTHTLDKVIPAIRTTLEFIKEERAMYEGNAVELVTKNEWQESIATVVFKIELSKSNMPVDSLQRQRMGLGLIGTVTVCMGREFPIELLRTSDGKIEKFLTDEMALAGFLDHLRSFVVDSALVGELTTV